MLLSPPADPSITETALSADPDGEGGMGMSIDYTKQGGGRREAQAAMRRLNADIDVAPRAIDAMPERIREALTPAAEAMSAVGARMVRLAEMPLPPQGVTDGRTPDSYTTETGSEYAESPG